MWPKRQAFRLLADSNLDSGQNDEKAGAWLAASGIPEARLDPVHLLSGTSVLSVNAVAGVFDFEQHRFLRDRLEPSAHLGHTYLVYDVAAGPRAVIRTLTFEGSPDETVANLRAMFKPPHAEMCMRMKSITRFDTHGLVRGKTDELDFRGSRQ